MLERRYWPVLIFNVLAVLAFTVLFVARRNYEFLMYVAVIVLFMVIIFATLKAVGYSMSTLWGLTLWALMHMAGGGLTVNGDRLYGLMLLPLVGEPYNILKYDQLVHTIGFFVATLVVWELLKPKLRENHGWVAIGIVVVMAGLGLGAMNEIVEFLATVVMPETGVGGYENTALDLVADLVGACMAWVYIRTIERKGTALDTAGQRI